MAPHRLVLCAIACIALSLSGCGGGGASSTTTTTTTSSTTSVRSTTSVAPKTTATTTTTTKLVNCLCVFDVDRTLTGRQGQAANCPNDKDFPSIPDKAYTGGTLLLSDLGLHLQGSFCDPCHLAIVSAGEASGDNSPERAKLLEIFGGKSRTLTDKWHTSGKLPIDSSLVLMWSDRYKQDAVAAIVEWFNSAHMLMIPDEEVYFFDDRIINVQPFNKTKFNAKQISCASRDPTSNPPKATGNCGGTKEELIKTKGVHPCIPPTPPLELVREKRDHITV